MRKRIEEINGQRSELDDLIEEGEVNTRSLQKVLDDLRSEREEQREKRDRIYKTLNAKREQIREVEETIAAHYRHREDVFETLRDLEIKLNDMTLRQEQLKQRIFDRYHIDILKRPYEPLDMDMQEMEEKIQKLSRRIELIGPVNMAVREEYHEESSRLDFLREQRADLQGAESTITETIDKLDIEARRQFLEIFSQIRENYKKTYKLFFEHGECDLRLEDSADPLEANVEIFSRPKGKQMMKSLRALSGAKKPLRQFPCFLPSIW
ncbi:MAG: hypothetical protein U5N56_12435 [Candidatus Marinimicrobia bacterium]|nr:hypothetical protein [Candidatus Neomarinimicrobiota bacterium]